MPNTQNKLNSQSTLCLSCPQPCLRKYNLEGTTWYQEKSSLHNILFFLNTSNCSCNENKRKQNKRKQKIPSKISCVQLPSCVKNKQKAVWMQSSSAVFPTIFSDFFFFLFNNDLWAQARRLVHWMTYLDLAFHCVWSFMLTSCQFLC